MNRNNQVPGVNDALIKELRSFHERCGKPSGPTLVAISRDLERLYPPPAGRKNVYATLSPTGISEILNGKRKRLLKFEWVAAFVLCCQRYTFEMRAISHDPGTSSLPYWFGRRAASAAAATASPGQAPRPDPACTIQLTPRQQAHLAGHGSYGQTLASQAQAGQPEAVYRAAILLATDAALSADALALLLQAAATGHGPSVELLEESPSRLLCFTAARHALTLAQNASTCGLRDEALAFYQAAARGGIPPASAATTQHGRSSEPEGPAQANAARPQPGALYTAAD